MNFLEIKQIQKTVLEMWKDQRYHYEQYETPDSPDLIYIDKSQQLLLIAHFLTASKIRPNFLKKTIQNFKEQYEETDYQLRLFLIMKDKPNSLLLNQLKQTPNAKLYWGKQLTYNISKHSYVPRHRLLSELEITQLIERYSLRSLKELPILLRSDPISQYYDFKKGDVCEITRNDSTCGESVSYRCVQ